jgi:murein DD-endopeptidase MepM/ murein hydrolase activator NlpD
MRFRRLMARARTPGRQRRPWHVAVVTVAVAVSFVALPATSSAQSSGAEKKEELQHQIGDASAQELQALQQLQGIRDEKAAIDARVAELDQQISAAQARLAEREAEASRLAAEYEKVRQRVVTAQSKLDRAQATLDDTAAQMYRSARNGSQYETALAAPPAAMVQSDAYLDTVSAKRRRIVEKVERLRDEIETKRRAVEADKHDADAARAAAQAERDTIGTLRAEIEPARAQAAERQAAEEQALASIQARKAEFEGELAALQAASASVTQLLAGGSRGTASNPCEARPVPGEIRSGFGSRVHPIYGTTRMHSGVDMAAGMGEPIRACRAGTVIQAGWNGGYGNTIVVDHGGGMATLYAHQSSLAAGVGAQVGAGEVIGYVGSTGASTGPHLHFEVRRNGNPVDPVPYL